MEIVIITVDYKQHISFLKPTQSQKVSVPFLKIFHNDVSYLTRYKTSKQLLWSFPLSKAVVEWLKKPNSILSVKDLYINNALWSWGVIKQDD